MNIDPMDVMKQMGTFQEKMSAIGATGSAGGGMVEIDLNGKLEISAVRIAKEAVEDGDTEMLEDLIMAAFSNGLEKTKEAISREMGSMMGGLNLSNFMGGA